MKLESLCLKLNDHLKEVKETSVGDSETERVDLGMERENRNERERSSVTSVNTSV